MQDAELENATNTTDPEVLAAQELAALKARADTLGITYKSNIGLDTLRARVNAVVTGEKSVAEVTEGASSTTSATSLTSGESPAAVETVQQLRDRVRRESLALVRVRIANMNPQKADLDGEIITVANKFIGTVTKMIPFGKATDNGYHIPKIIYDDLIGRQFQQVYLKKDSRGNEVVQTRLVPEYNIQILKPLTPEELQELALQQQAAERLGA